MAGRTGSKEPRQVIIYDDMRFGGSNKKNYEHALLMMRRLTDNVDERFSELMLRFKNLSDENCELRRTVRAQQDSLIGLNDKCTRLNSDITAQKILMEETVGAQSEINAMELKILAQKHFELVKIINNLKNQVDRAQEMINMIWSGLGAELPEELKAENQRYSSNILTPHEPLDPLPFFNDWDEINSCC